MISDQNCGIEYAAVEGSTDRAAAAYNVNEAGVLVSIGDVPIAETTARLLDLMFISSFFGNGHSHGIVFTGPCSGFADTCRFSNNKGDGVVFTQGGLFDWTEIDDVPGLFEFRNGAERHQFLSNQKDRLA